MYGLIDAITLISACALEKKDNSEKVDTNRTDLNCNFIDLIAFNMF